MIAMLASFPSQSHGLASTMTLSPTGTLNSNTAGSPLPIIPRRTSSVIRSYPGGNTTPPKATPNPVQITVQQATPPDDNQPSTSSSSPSTSSSSGRLSPVRSRSLKKAPTLADQTSSPTFGVPRSKKENSASHTDLASEGASSSLSKPAAAPLRLSLEGLPPRNQSEVLVAFPSVEPTVHKSAPIVPPPAVVRKKSGQLVKPSLKSSKSSFKGSLSLAPGGMPSSKSEPATPTVAKAVKFDSRLEHVKLFLAEQRPLAVSRDGSPTDDTSGTESDFPSFIFGGDSKKGKILKLTLVNMPPIVNVNADLVMQQIKLSAEGTSICGRVRVRNLSFQKWIAVRFTFDEWQTTSEVTAKYIESAGPDFDIFSFTIRLTDLMARIEEKTLIIALRYNVAGREIWDNNFGRNYIVRFLKETPKVVEKPRSLSGSDRDLSSGSDISDLHSRLEKVAKKRDTEPPRARTALSSPEPAVDFKKETSLASRYDFGVSLKNPFNTTTRDHVRTHSYPMGSPGSGSVPWPDASKKRRPIPKAKPALGSPRDLEDDFRIAPFVPSDAEDGEDVNQETNARHHQRGYFDLSAIRTSSLRMTPPSTPRSLSGDTTPTASPRYYSLPSIRPQLPVMGFSLGPRDLPLPSDSSDSSASLASSPFSDLSTPSVMSPLDEEPASPKTNYNQFLNRFCFFTGSEYSGNSSDEEPLSRSSSTSSIDDFVASASPRLHEAGFRLFSPQPVTQTRDDISIRSSGSSTPGSYSASPSRSVTPVAI